jgi:alanyl-tRNA synthetase
MRLEQKDSYLRTFRSRVAEIEYRNGALWATLTASAFYPTSGGQLYDEGSLNGLPIVDVTIRDNRVWHCLIGEGTTEPGDEAEGIIDWARRYRHMQRHTGQHLLSQAFLRVDCTFKTHSVSLSSPNCTIDLGGQLQARDLELAETLVNKTAYGNLPIRAFEVEASEVNRYPLRRPPKIKGLVRLVEMGDFELSACGGTHLRATAEAAPIKVLKSTRIRGEQTRVTFRVGLEAIEDYRLKHRVTSSLTSSFSAVVSELPNRIDGLRSSLATERQTTGTLIERLTSLVAKDIPKRPWAKGSTVTVHIFKEGEGDLLRSLASNLTNDERNVALLAICEPTKARLLFTRSADLDTDMNAILQTALAHIDGTGGGSSSSAQGAGVRPDKVGEALEIALQALRDSEDLRLQ